MCIHLLAILLSQAISFVVTVEVMAMQEREVVVVVVEEEEQQQILAFSLVFTNDEGAIPKLQNG